MTDRLEQIKAREKAATAAERDAALQRADQAERERDETEARGVAMMQDIAKQWQETWAEERDKVLALQRDLDALRQQIAEDFAAMEGWLLSEGTIIADAPRTRKPGHGSCCTCQTCGFRHDDCCCDENERTASWQTVKSGLRALLPKGQ